VPHKKVRSKREFFKKSFATRKITALRKAKRMREDNQRSWSDKHTGGEADAWY
jgi:hypothetical protein